MQRILIVEDSPTMRSLLGLGSRRPRRAGEDHRGRERLRGAAPAAARAFDLIVTDINMPDINGLELVSFVKTNDGLPLDSAHHRVDRGLRARPRQGPEPRRRRLPREALRPGGSPPARAGPARRDVARAEQGRRSWRRATFRIAGRQRRRTASSSPRPRRSSSGCARISPISTISAPRGGEVDPDLVNRLFRSAHSLKGAGGHVRPRGDPRISPTTSRTSSTASASAGCRSDSPAVGLIDEAVALFASLLESVGDAGGAGGSFTSRWPDLARRIEAAKGALPARAGEFEQLGHRSRRCCGR